LEGDNEGVVLRLVTISKKRHRKERIVLVTVCARQFLSQFSSAEVFVTYKEREKERKELFRLLFVSKPPICAS
jgi:hypothetical protein